MRLLDQDTDKKIGQVSMFFTRSEATQLRDALTDLLEHPERHHDHISSEDFQKEITIAIYDESNLKGFRPKVAETHTRRYLKTVVFEPYDIHF